MRPRPSISLIMFRRRGFTLTELLTVIAILGALTSIGFYAFRSARQFADRRETEAAAAIKRANANAQERRMLAWNATHRVGREPMPPLLTMAESQALRDEVLRYLAMKAAGVPSSTPLPAVDPSLASVEAYELAAKQPNSAAQLYRLLHDHLLAAEGLLATPSNDQRLDGLDVIREVALCSVERLRDSWLGPRICNAFLLPRLALASTERIDKTSAPNLITTCIYVFGESKAEADAMTGYRLLLHMGEDENALDACRLRLATALEQQGKIQEAIFYLEQIRADGDLGGTRVVLDALKKKLASTTP